MRRWGFTGASGLTRRQVARGAAVAAGALAADSLAGTVSALASPRAARAAAVHGKIRLVVSIAYQGSGTYQGSMQKIVEGYLADTWLRKHPGVELTTISGMGCNGTCLGAQDEIAETIAGQPADVIAGCCDQWYEYLVADLMRPLDPFIKQENMDLSIFSPGHLAGLTTPKGILAFPEYDGPQVMSVNLGMLDAMGIPYPADDWTYQDAEKIWRAVARAGKNGTRIYGAGVSIWGHDDVWVPRGFGGAMGNAEGTLCTLDRPEAIAAYEWWTPMQLAQVFGGGRTEVARGTCAMCMQGGWDIQSDLFAYQGLKWRYFGMPRFPAGQATFINNDFYAINNFSKNPPDLVWDIFKFVTTDRGFLELEFKTTFVTPNRVDLWGDWIDIVYQVAPGLKGKNLEAYAEAVKYGTAQYFFKYENSTAMTLVNKYFGMIQSRQMSVADALTQLAKQVNTLERTGAAIAAAQARESVQVEGAIAAVRAGRAKAFPQPSPQGVGVPPASGTALVGVRNGSYALVGSGGGIHGTDGGTFACVATTAPHASFVCRLVQLSTVNALPISNGAKFGLMIREDLTDDTAMVGLVVSGQEGFIGLQRIQAQLDPSRQKAGNASSLLKPFKTSSGAAIKEANYLKAPVWLRIDRAIDQFTLYTSSDGSKWTKYWGPLKVEMAGAWVGLIVTSNDRAHRIRAVFDHVSGFTPDRYVVLGG